MNFNNNLSNSGFIGNRELEEVISSDNKELAAIGGSFKAIADRMKQVLDYIDSHKWPERIKNHKFDKKLTLKSYMQTKGPQFCPFEGCGTNTWSEVVVIENPNTARKLYINRGTEHLAREHHLLEKDNQYGISAQEFYKNFMQEE